jgi:hypothetical protein
MNRSHLLFWIFEWLDSHADTDTIEDMKENMPDEKWSNTEGAWTIRQSFLEAVEEWKKAREKK